MSEYATRGSYRETGEDIIQWWHQEGDPTDVPVAINYIGVDFGLRLYDDSLWFDSCTSKSLYFGKDSPDDLIWSYSGEGPYACDLYFDPSEIYGVLDADADYKIRAIFTDCNGYGETKDVTLNLNTGSVTPGKAINPTPADNDTEVDFTGFKIEWEDGGDTDYFRVYIGETGSLTKVCDVCEYTDYTTDLEELEDIFDASPIEQKIYWRVDAVNGDTVVTGDEWNFDPRPGKATSPSPTDEATDEDVGVTLSWTAGTNAVTENVNGGETGSIEELETENEAAEYYWSLDWGTEYQWRIDSVNAFGTATGDVWSFTTLSYDPPLPFWVNLPGKTLGPLTGGTEGVDFRWLGTNCMSTVKKLVVAAGSALWYEDR
jgi:hypothetical protein